MDAKLTVRRIGKVWFFSDGRRLPVVRGGDGPSDEAAELDRLLTDLATEGALAALSDEDLSGHEEDLVAAAEAIDPVTATAEQVETLDRIATTVEALRAERTQREESASQRASEAAARLARIRGEQPAQEGEGAEGADSGEGSTEGEGGEEGGAAPSAEGEPLPVAASGTGNGHAAPGRPRPSIARLARNRPAANAPRPRTDDGGAISLRSVTAAAGAAGFQPGQTLTLDQVAEAIVNKALAMRRGGAATYEPIHVASFNMNYPRDRVLHESDVQHNRRVLDSVMSPAAIAANRGKQLQGVTAAGGFCAPLTPDYSVPTLSADNRPLRDSGATPAFQGAGRRGGTRFMTSPRLGDYSGGVAAWTEADDASATDGSPTKPCIRIDCGDEITAKAEALTKCLTVGNFFDRTYPEMVRAVLDVLNADAARFAEERHIAVMGTAGTPVADGRDVRRYTANELLGTSRNLVSVLKRAHAAYQYIFRTPDTLPFRVTLPRWARQNVAVDLAREMPGAPIDRLMTDDNYLGRLLASMGPFNVTWLWDGPSNQRFSHLLTGNTLVGWPDTFEMDFYPEGTWGAIDGGMLDLGIVRSPDLNEVNDLQIWSESFEGVFWRGPGTSWHISADVCPDGSSSGTVDIDPCSSGS